MRAGLASCSNTGETPYRDLTFAVDTELSTTLHLPKGFALPYFENEETAPIDLPTKVNVHISDGTYRVRMFIPGIEAPVRKLFISAEHAAGIRHRYIQQDSPLDMYQALAIYAFRTTAENKEFPSEPQPIVQPYCEAFAEIERQLQQVRWSDHQWQFIPGNTGTDMTEKGLLCTLRKAR